MPENPKNHALRSVSDHIQESALQEVAWRQDALTGGLSQLRALLQSKTDDWYRQAKVLNQRAQYLTLFQTAEAESVIETLCQPKESAD